jgi:pimeloyl-ACP methyl ester carboxylesterase
MISVERAGFGLTPPDPAWSYSQAADDALAVLDGLGIERYRIVAVSGGGPYAAALAAAASDRVVSLHLAAAAAGPLIGETMRAPLSGAAIAAIVSDPEAWWRYPAESSVHRVPGFQAAAGAEGRRALAAHGEAALAQEWARLCSEPLPDLSAVRAPAYLYWGSADEVVTPAHAAAWLEALPNVAAAREYTGEGHDIQYRHWDQILIDAARGPGRTLVCRAGRTWLVPDHAVPAGAELGLCCWSERMRA